MVVKLGTLSETVEEQFESCVVLDGSQTGVVILNDSLAFESCVVLDGSQTGGKTRVLDI